MPRIKVLLSILVLVAISYVGYKVVPVYLNNYQFQDEIQSISRFGAYTGRTDEEIRRSIQEKVSNLGLPLRPEDVHMVRQGRDVTIWADYTVHVDLPAHPVNLRFQPAARNGEKIDPSAVPYDALN